MILIFKNERGQEIAIGHRRPYWINTYNGINAAEAEISTHNLITDGVGVSNIRLASRKIDLLGGITNPNVKSQMLRVCRPGMEGEAIIGERGIHCIVERCELDPPKKDKPWWTFTISFLAPFPYFYDVNEDVEKIVSWESAWTFPFAPPLVRTFIFGSRDEVGRATIANDGETACPCRIKITAKEGVVNPSVAVIETGEVMAFNYSMNAGDIIEVDTYPGRQSVKLNGVENYNILDVESDYFWLPEGSCKVQYAAASGALSMEVEIRYRAYYIGGIE